MMTMLQYAWRGSRRGFIVLLFGFLATQALLFFNMKSLHLFQLPAYITDQASVSIFILSSVFCLIFLMIQAIQMYRKLLKSKVLQATPLAGLNYVVVPILLCLAGFAVLTICMVMMGWLYLSTHAAETVRIITDALKDLSTGSRLLVPFIIVYGIAAMLIHIFFAITFAKSLRLAKGLQVLIALVTLFLLTWVFSWVSDQLQGIGPVFTITDHIQLYQTWDASLHMKETTFSIISLVFDFITTAALFTGAVYLIDKRMER